MSAVVALEPDLEPSSLSEAERLGEEIAELCVYLHVAKAHLLDLIREFKDVSAETSRARWYAGEQMDMEYAVWVMANTKPPGQTRYERPE